MWGRQSVSVFVQSKQTKEIVNKIMAKWVGILRIKNGLVCDNGANSLELKEVASILDVKLQGWSNRNTFVMLKPGRDRHQDCHLPPLCQEVWFEVWSCMFPWFGCVLHTSAPCTHDWTHYIPGHWHGKTSHLQRQGESDATKKASEVSKVSPVSEWVIKFNGLSGDSGQRGPYNPCNHSLYIGIIIFPHIDNTQSTGHN